MNLVKLSIKELEGLKGAIEKELESRLGLDYKFNKLSKIEDYSSWVGGYIDIYCKEFGYNRKEVLTYKDVIELFEDDVCDYHVSDIEPIIKHYNSRNESDITYETLAGEEMDDVYQEIVDNIIKDIKLEAVKKGVAGAKYDW